MTQWKEVQLAMAQRDDEEAKCGIISVRAEGGLMRKRETRNAMRRSF